MQLNTWEPDMRKQPFGNRSKKDKFDKIVSTSEEKLPTFSAWQIMLKVMNNCGCKCVCHPQYPQVVSGITCTTHFILFCVLCMLVQPRVLKNKHVCWQLFISIYTLTWQVSTFICIDISDQSQANHHAFTIAKIYYSTITSLLLSSCSSFLALLLIKFSMSLLPVARKGYRTHLPSCFLPPLSPVRIANVALTWVTLPLVHGAKQSETGGERVDGISSGKEFWAGELGDSFSSLWLLADKKQRNRGRIIVQMCQRIFLSICQILQFTSAKYVWTCKCIYPTIGRHNDKLIQNLQSKTYCNN